MLLCQAPGARNGEADLRSPSGFSLVTAASRKVQASVPVLIERLFRRVELLTTVSLAEHFVEMSLSIPESAVDGLVYIRSPLRCRVAAGVHSHQPGRTAASDDLADFSCHRAPPAVRGKQMARGFVPDAANHPPS